MILKALADYYERMLKDRSLNPPPYGFEDKPIPFLLVINEAGKLVNIRDTRTGDKNKVSRSFRVPQGEKKASGIKENLLWDNPQYVLGAPKSNKAKDIEKANKAMTAFVRRLCNDLGDLKDEGIEALMKFYENNEPATVHGHALFGSIMEDNANTTFILEGDAGLIAQRPKVIERIKALYEEGCSKRQVSAINGRHETTAILHSAIKGVWGAQSSGANIVSFNLDAFRSFGKKQGLNAPIGKHNEFAYTTALNYLLAKGSNQRMQVGDASTVFWARDPCDIESDLPFYLSPRKGEEGISCEKIKGLLAAVKNGIPPAEADLPFYVLGLAPNVSRIAIRFWYDGDVKEIKERVAQHFEDIEMIRSPFDAEFLTMQAIVLATTRHSTKHPFGDRDDVNPLLAGNIFAAVIRGTAYPRTLLQKIVNRVKAEQGLCNSIGKKLENVTHARAALLKAFLVRNTRLTNPTQKEVSVALDREYDNIGYVLGRLFAILERIQEMAQGSGLNKTIRDTYFGGAASSPQVIFRRLQELSVHHLAKIKNAGKNTGWIEKEKGEVIDLVPKEGSPATLSLEDQGRFAVGYYHQRQDFFKKKETPQKEEETNNE